MTKALLHNTLEITRNLLNLRYIFLYYLNFVIVFAILSSTLVQAAPPHIEVIALFESKCRNMSLVQLEKYGSWLITNEKIEQCKLLSKLLEVPFLGFLYLLEDKLVMFWKITNYNGEYEFDFEIKKTLTQKTISGGEIYRENAFLTVDKGQFVQDLVFMKNTH